MLNEPDFSPTFLQRQAQALEQRYVSRISPQVIEKRPYFEIRQWSTSVDKRLVQPLER